MSVPPALAHTLREVHGPAGDQWLADLPSLLTHCAAAWNLTLESPFPNLTYHYVAPAVTSDGRRVVLKVGVPGSENRRERDALLCYDGRACVRLIASDPLHGALLLERLEPGASLLTLWACEEDAQATAIAASVMRRLWRPVPAVHAFPHVAHWGEGFARLRARCGGGTGPLPPALVTQAERLFAELTASMTEPVLLHADLHHDNILADSQGTWRAIDPKGVIGEPAYEAGAFLRNPLPSLLQTSNPGQLLARRLAILSEHLEIDQSRLRGWGIAQAVLSAWWSLEDHGCGWEDAVRCAELLK